MTRDDRFGPAARRLAGAAARLLGWRPGEFWAATPAELAAALLPDDDAGSPRAMSRVELMRLMEQENGQEQQHR